MKYLKYLQTTNDFESFKNSEDYVLPNVSYVVETEGVSFEPEPSPPPQLAGDIVYYKDNYLKSISYSNWTSDLGEPVGVITIPKGFAPDGKARMMSLSQIVATKWCSSYTNASLIDYFKVPITDNMSSVSTDSNAAGYLPSDKFTGTVSYVDPATQYKRSERMIPSPYLTRDGKNEPNSAYYEVTDWNNALSDFNGFANTKTLVNAGTAYIAANTCWRYRNNIQWYLPACGELGYMVSRFKEISAAFDKLGERLITSEIYLSSTECGMTEVYYIDPYDGMVNKVDKFRSGYVSPWAIVE